jgi:hypothetical protein
MLIALHVAGRVDHNLHKGQRPITASLRGSARGAFEGSDFILPISPPIAVGAPGRRQGARTVPRNAA